MEIEQFDLGSAMAGPLNMLAQMRLQEAYRNALSQPQGLPAETYNALAANGGPTNAAAAAVNYGASPYADDDWTRGRVDGVNPDLVELLALTREETGIPFFVTEGMRDRARQAELLAAGKSQTMNSRHLRGQAIDIAIPGANGAVNWDFDAYVPIGNAFKRIATERGYDDAVWGGDWTTLRDGVHFQLG